jgi:hypothetical protein
MESTLYLDMSLLGSPLVRLESPNPVENIAETRFFSLWIHTAVRAVENTPTASGDMPIHTVTIVKAGELAPGEDDGTDLFKSSRTGTRYEDYPDDEETVDVQAVRVIVNVAREVREAGNALFKEGSIEKAVKEYRSLFLSFSDGFRSLVLSLGSRIATVSRCASSSSRRH